MKRILFAAQFAIFVITLSAQSVWMGGTSGRETDWMEARNWLDKKIPGADDYVLIPHLGHDTYPVIQSAVPEIAGLKIEGGARLEILPDGVVTLNVQRPDESGLSLGGPVINQGVIRIDDAMTNTTVGGIENLVLVGAGKVVRSAEIAIEVTWVEE